MWYTTKIMPDKYRVSSRRDQQSEKDNDQESKENKKSITPKLLLDSLWLLPWCFWMLPMSQILQSGVVGGMQGSFNDIIRM